MKVMRDWADNEELMVGETHGLRVQAPRYNG
jgi:hypothetical protein